jgi:acyl-coenzyme A synthetase/AMP-(fatty) acid ligase
LCGGEALDATLAGDLVRRADHVWNVYGPAEATVWSACAPVLAGVPVTIGRPIANTQLYVLDDDLEPAPVGVAGQLYIGGAGLASGYLGRPALTAERFWPDPFGRGRLYRTGDMARWRPDGALEFLGRMDRQVKVRGHRIELGEIENLLCAHPAVLAAAVTARGDGKQLVAYVVIDQADRADTPDDDAIPTSQLRAFLGRALPDYLLPDAFVRLPALPLTPSGKVDRQALPPPEPQNGQPTGPAGPTGPTGPQSASGEPQTRTERLLAGIWRSVLDLPHVDADDNFFEIGGHSLARAWMRWPQRACGRSPASRAAR